MIELPPLGALGTSLWHVLLDLRGATDGWTLVGGQMVLLLALEHENAPPRVSEDIDVVADVRARPPRMPRLVAALNAAGSSSISWFPTIRTREQAPLPATARDRPPSVAAPMRCNALLMSR